MKRSILVRGARQLITMQGRSGPRRGDQMRELNVIEDGSVLIADGVIQRVGATRQVENLSEAKNAEEVNAAGRVVMPGFVDADTQLIAPPARVVLSRNGEAGELPVAGSPGFRHAIQWVRNAAPSTLESNARKYLEAALRHGTTTLETKTGYALNHTGEMKSLRVLTAIGNSVLSLVPAFCGAHALPPEFETAEEYIGLLNEHFIAKLRERKAVRLVDAFCDPTGFTPEELRPYLAAAARAGYPLRLHGDVTGRAGCVPLAYEFSAIAVAGLHHMSETDIDVLSGLPTIATLLTGRIRPGAEGKLPPGRALLDRGAAVAIASGFHPSLPSTFNMQAAIALACTAMGFRVEEAITAATVNAAFAVGRGMACGTLEAGRQADLLILNVSDYREIALLYGCNIVHQAMRGGEVVCREAPVTCGKS